MSAVGGTGSAAGAVSSGLTADTNTFLKLLTAQVQNQDPLNPVSDTEFVSQLAQFSQLSSVNNLNTSFSEMLKLQQLSQGTSLIGKTVSYTPASGSPTSGKVTGVTLSNGAFVVQVNGSNVGLDQITNVN